jgi:hypothetical protein
LLATKHSVPPKTPAAAAPRRTPAEKSAAHRPPTPPVEEVEQRNLADYDQVFGLAEVMA